MPFDECIGCWARTRRAGTIFPVGVIQCLLRQGKYAKHVSNITPVVLAAVLEYVTPELVDVAGIAAHKNMKKKIILRYLEQVIDDDLELCKFFRDVIDK